MFLAIIGLREMGWVAHDNATLVTLGETGSWTYESGELWAMVGLIAIAIMMARGIKGAIIYGILAVSVIGWGLSVSDPYNQGYAVINFCFENDAGETVCDYTSDFVAGVAGRGTAEAPTEIFGFVGMPEETLGAALSALGDIGGTDGTSLGAFLLVMITFLFVDIFIEDSAEKLARINGNGVTFTALGLYFKEKKCGYDDESQHAENAQKNPLSF